MACMRIAEVQSVDEDGESV